MTPQTMNSAARSTAVAVAAPSTDAVAKLLKLAVLGTAATLAVLGLISAHGQTFQMASSTPAFGSSTTLVAPDAASETSSSSLPEAPSALMASSENALNASVPDGAVAMMPQTSKVAPKYATTIPAGYSAQPLTPHDKVIFGIRDSVSLFSFAGTVFSAGYSHITNGEPNYGTDRGAFGERLGATAIRDTTGTIFAESFLAPAFHEDPRYYVQGNSHNFLERVIYSGTRPILTRTDKGGSTINSSLLIGYAAASALSYTYYPKGNQNFHDTASTFGGSLAGAALGDIVTEFADSTLVLLHLKKAQ